MNFPEDPSEQPPYAGSRGSGIDWDRLAGHVERFLEEWEAGGCGPPIGGHLPEAHAAQRRAVLIELIKVDLEYRYASDGPLLKLEDYLEENPELGLPDGMPAELIFEEYHIRAGACEDVTVAEYVERFPEQQAAIEALFPPGESSAMSPTGQSLAEAFQPGERVGDFYLMSNLGTGAFGSVFLARQESMQRMVALKISGDTGNEGQTLAQLDHPHIVRIHDQTRLPDQNLRLMYMQFAPGGTLQRVIQESRTAKKKTGRIVAECIAEAVEQTGVLSSQNIPLKGGFAEKSWAEVTCQLGMELAQALHYAHGRGILHRDIKPANVLLEANGAAKLADFNISFGSGIEGDSADRHFGGSLAYMSPEQIEAFDPGHAKTPEELDARADVYSLGVLLWELFYGQRPFDDESVTGSVSEMLAGLRKLRQAGPPTAVKATSAAETQLRNILQRCLDPDPASRYQTASELARDLGLCLQPRVARLIMESRTGWRSLALSWAVVAVLVAAVCPHVPAAVFNYAYNEQSIMRQLPESARNVFTLAVIFINAIAFSVGIAFCVWYSRPVRDFVANRAVDVTKAKRRAFGLSRFVTAVGISEWTIAGMAYPVILQFLTPDGLHIRWQAHFFVSLLICGLVAAAYPFFLTSALSIRTFLPAILRSHRLTSDDRAALNQLSERSSWSLYLAGGVPAIGIMILLFTQEAAESSFPLRVFSILGAVGFALALSLARSLQSDIEAIVQSSRTIDEADV